MLLEERINVFDVKKAREICDKYIETKRTPYLRGMPVYDSQFAADAEVTLPAALDEIERLESECCKLIKLLSSQADKAENFRRKNDELEAENEKLKKALAECAGY